MIYAGSERVNIKSALSYVSQLSWCWPTSADVVNCPHRCLLATYKVNGIQRISCCMQFARCAQICLKNFILLGKDPPKKSSPVKIVKRQSKKRTGLFQTPAIRTTSTIAMLSECWTSSFPVAQCSICQGWGGLTHPLVLLNSPSFHWPPQK